MFRTVVAVAATGLAAAVLPVLPVLPADAAGTVKASVSLSGPGAGVYGSAVTLSGTAWRTGTSTKLVNATIWLQRAAHGSTAFTDVRSTHTSSTGTFSFSVTQGTPYDYRARYGGSATYTTAVSPKTYPAVRQYVRMDSLKDTNWTLGTIEAKATILPVQHSGGKVWLQRYNPATKTWTNYISALTTGSSQVTIRGNVGGNTGTYRIYMPQRFSYADGWSATKVFTHYKWRGAFARALVAQGGTNTPIFQVVDATAAVPQANDGGTVWGDLNTAGCTRITADLTNGADGDTKVSIIGSAHPTSVVVPKSPAERTLADTISNKPTVRMQVEDVGTSDGPLMFTETSVLCAN